MIIRKYKDSDREAVENIHFETGFVGSSMSKLLSNKKLWRLQISNYLDKEKESIFVLENNGKVVGYVLGCVAGRKGESNFKLTMDLFGFFIRSRALPKKDRRFWRGQIIFLFNIIGGKSGELKLLRAQGSAGKSTGHLHINLLPAARGKGWGTKLLEKYEKYAKKKGTTMLFADSFKTRLNKNTNFWMKNGFKELLRTNSAYWKASLPDEKIDLVCYAKTL